MFDMATCLTQQSEINQEYNNNLQSEIQSGEILYLDDEYVNYLYFNELLSDTYYKVTRVGSIEQAIQNLSYSSKFKTIVLSCCIVENSNYEVIRLLKFKFPFIPVVAIFDSKSLLRESDCLNAGVDMCINRYTDSTYLVEIMNELISHPSYYFSH